MDCQKQPIFAPSLNASRFEWLVKMIGNIASKKIVFKIVTLEEFIIVQCVPFLHLFFAARARVGGFGTKAPRCGVEWSIGTLTQSSMRRVLWNKRCDVKRLSERRVSVAFIPRDLQNNTQKIKTALYIVACLILHPHFMTVTSKVVSHCICFGNFWEFKFWEYHAKIVHVKIVHTPKLSKLGHF